MVVNLESDHEKPLGLADLSSQYESSLPPLSLSDFDLPSKNGVSAQLSDFLGISPMRCHKSDNKPPKTFQCGEFQYPDLSSPLNKILSDSRRGRLYDLGESAPAISAGARESPRGGRYPDVGSYRAVGSGLPSSPLAKSNNPMFDDVFIMSSRSPETSPYSRKYNNIGSCGGRSNSPESDVGYGTSFGSNQSYGPNIDIDGLSNLLRSLSINRSGSKISGNGGAAGFEPNSAAAAASAFLESNLGAINPSFLADPIAGDNDDDEDEDVKKAKEPERKMTCDVTVGSPVKGGQQQTARVGCAPDIDPAVAQVIQTIQNFASPHRRRCNDSNMQNFLASAAAAAAVTSPMRNSGRRSFDTLSLEKAARMHRSSAASVDASCTWSGQLPPRNHHNNTLSCKVFLGGVPWDITEMTLHAAFKPFGSIRIEWPGKDNSCVPRGYLYIIFEHEKQVRSLLSACTHDFDNGGRWYYKISSRRMRNKEVQVIPWVIMDSTFARAPSQRLDPKKTVFVGALHGMMNAEGLGSIFQDLFSGVVYAGIDTDKHKYPIGSGRVTFNNHKSYMKAVSAAFIEVKTAKFAKKIQVDPYLEDEICSSCAIVQGPYFCRDRSCFKYFCRQCWNAEHSVDVMAHHSPIMRNSRASNNARNVVSPISTLPPAFEPFAPC